MSYVGTSVEQKPIPIPVPIEVQCRFWSRVDQGEPDDCWEWDGATINGYGVIGLKGLKLGNFLTHRLSYAIATGIDPGVMLVLHECNNRICVNPSHLWLGTSQDNNQHRVDSGNQTDRFIVSNAQKFHPEDIRQIRQLLDSGLSNRKVANRYGVSPSTISAIRTGFTWKHVE